MNNVKKNLKVIIFVLIIMPIAFILTACGNEEKLLNFENISFVNQTINYDGNEHELLISGNLPNGANVQYQNNVATNSGVYNAKATISLDGYKTLELFATLTINKLNYDMSQVSWDYVSAFTYNANEQKVELIGNLPSGVTIKQYSNNMATDAGNYIASVEFNYDIVNHNKPIVPVCNWVINKATIDTSSMAWDYEDAFAYDSTEKVVSLINVPSIVSVSYNSNRATNAGKYTAIATFNYDKKNYNEITIENLSWEIEKIDITGITFDNKTVEYDSLEHSIELIGNVPANSTVTITYDNKAISGVVEVGEYEVKLVITNINYNKFETTAKLKITSTEEKLYSVVYKNKLYFQNNLDSNKLYSYDGVNLSKVNNDKAEYFTINGDELYYYSSSLLSKVIKSYNGMIASSLLEVAGDYITCDGAYIYYAVNNLLKTSTNGIYKIKLDGSENAIRLVKNKAEYLTYYNGNIYYSNVSDGRKLYSVSTNANDLENGTLIYDEKVSDIIIDNGVLYFNSTSTVLGVGVASAIRKYTISDSTCIKLTTDNGSYLTKVGSYLYYVNKDKITSELFGDGIYKVSVLKSDDSSMPGTKVLSIENNGYSSLSSNGNCLYYYKLNNKHIYSFDLSSQEETDIMENFVVQNNDTISGYAKLAEYNGEIYYTNTLDDGCLYKYNLSTKCHYKVLSNSVSNVYFYNGYMYYSTYVSVNYSLWKMDLLTNESVKISSNRCDNLIFDNDTIYYVKVGAALTYNNHIMKMGLNGENPTELYGDKNLWVASLEKVGENIYFTINPMIGKKYVYKYNIASSIGESLELRSNYLTISNGIMYYYNLEDNSLNSYNLSTAQESVLISNVDINNMIISNGYIYYSTTQSGNVGLYKYNLSNGINTKLSDKCADGMIDVDNKIYFIQTAISYSNDYPNNSNGDGNLYCYDGTSIIKL